MQKKLSIFICLHLVFILNIYGQSVTQKKKLFIQKVLPNIQKVYAHNLEQGKYVHPISITLAQAAIESGWGGSRFFKEANNIFGVWASSSAKYKIAAKKKRAGKTIWLRKYKTLQESIMDYYATISKKKVYKNFRKLNAQNADVYALVKELKMYSERREIYTKELAQIIRYNHFTKYDKEETPKASQ